MHRTTSKLFHPAWFSLAIALAWPAIASAEVRMPLVFIDQPHREAIP